MGSFLMMEVPHFVLCALNIISATVIQPSLLGILRTEPLNFTICSSATYCIRKCCLSYPPPGVPLADGPDDESEELAVRGLVDRQRLVRRPVGDPAQLAGPEQPRVAAPDEVLRAIRELYIYTKTPPIKTTDTMCTPSTASLFLLPSHRNGASACPRSS